MFESDNYDDRLRTIRAMILTENKALATNKEDTVLQNMAKQAPEPSEAATPEQLPSSPSLLVPTTWTDLTPHQQSSSIRDFVACEYGKAYASDDAAMGSIHTQLLAFAKSQSDRFVWNGSFISMVEGLRLREVAGEERTIEVYFEDDVEVVSDSEDGAGLATRGGGGATKKESLSDMRSRLQAEKSAFFA
jgi:hypothetical protein